MAGRLAVDTDLVLLLVGCGLASVSVVGTAQ